VGQETSEKIARLEREIEELKKENERLRRLLEEALRSAKRQAAPFSRRGPKAHPQKPGRKAGSQYGRRCRRPIPRSVDEVIDVPLPGQCPYCGGGVQEEEIVSQYQTEIPEPEWSALSFAFLWDAVGIATGGCRVGLPGRPPMRSAVPLRN